MMSQADAFAVLFRKNNHTGALEKLAITPVIKDTPNPTWSTAIPVNYMFEVSQEVSLAVLCVVI
jgi:secreted protein with Ig-like and vWFA domain